MNGYTRPGRTSRPHETTSTSSLPPMRPAGGTTPDSQPSGPTTSTIPRPEGPPEPPPTTPNTTTKTTPKTSQLTTYPGGQKPRHNGRLFSAQMAGLKSTAEHALAVSC